MAVRYSEEFKADVVRVALAREKGTTLVQIARDFGTHEMTLAKWIRAHRIEEGIVEGLTSAEKTELREAKKRIRLLEMENEVLRRAAAYLSQANLPGK